jgi:hypothetical protein
LIDEVLKDLSLEGQINVQTTNSLNSCDSGVKWFGNATLYLPDFLNTASFEQLRAKHINQLLKKEYNFEITKPTVWASPEGRAVIESFVLSDSAKKFLISRDLQPICLLEKLYDAFAVWTGLYLAMLIQSKYREKMAMMASKKLKDKFFGSKNPVLQFGLVTVPISMFFVYLLYVLIQTNLQRDCDALALTKGGKNSSQIRQMTYDESKQFDTEYYLGAMEYYQKVLDRNRALATIIKGDDQGSWFKKILLLGIFSESGGEIMNGCNLPSDLRLKNIIDWEKS